MEKIIYRMALRLAALVGLIGSTVVVAVAQTPPAPTPPGATLFEKSCYSCHNIGAGDKKGPDLKGVTTAQTRQWLHEFIQSPAAMNRKGDPVATQLFKKFAPEVMPDQTLSPDQVDQILTLIDDLSKKNEQFVPAGARLARPIVPTDIDEGYQLFAGKMQLTGGGTACISCHNVNGVGRLGGGTLGPDLTAALTKYKDPELISILQNPNFPTMKSVFGTKQLSDEEIVKLFAFLQNAKLQNPALQAQPGVTRIEPWFVGFGVGALLLSLVAMDRAWRKRLRGVREELVRRAKQ